jgi:cell division septation protein DedD
MSAATTHAARPQPPARAQVGEWFWRFLAVVMLIVVAWVVWIAIQISPPEMVLPAAYEAAAQGRARSSSGTIGNPAAPGPVQAIVDTSSVSSVASGAPPAATEPAAPAAPVEPPVNLEKLRRAESIETPIPERPRRVPKPAPDAPQ